MISLHRYTARGQVWHISLAFLTDLAVEGNVVASTQKQAKSALLILFQRAMGRELGFLDVTPADKPERLHVVLSRPEIANLLPEFQGLRRLFFLTMCGAGLRHRECRRLRVKDACFDERHMIYLHVMKKPGLAVPSPLDSLV